MQPSRICFLARSLEVGGAERQLVLLAAALRRAGHDVAVLTFYPGGAFAGELHGAGIEHVSLDKRGRWHVVGFVFRLAAEIRRLQPDYLLSYLTVPNVVAALLRPFIGRARLLWGVRASKLIWAHCGRLDRLANWLEARLSWVPDLIITNSQAGAEHHARLGFPVLNMTVIANGIDVETFRPDPGYRAHLRDVLDYGDDHVVIGCFARLDPMKGHDDLLTAVASLVAGRPSIRLLLLGDAKPDARKAIDRRIRDLELEAFVRCLPGQMGVAAYMNAVDIAVSASHSEGFSNAVAEAMACGVPCVVTDVGDSGAIVGDTGVVVPPASAAALAGAIGRLLAMSAAKRGDLGRRARERIVREFSIEALVQRTERALMLAAGKGS